MSAGSTAPVIIIGAARSGTNILRDVLVQIVGLGTWPCDEINYLWRHGNTGHPTDELPPSLASEPVRRFIRGRFDRIAAQRRIEHVVEKTCANSLRVAFVDRIFPDARLIVIVRDGRDVVPSAIKRWTARLDLAYTLRKARYVPLSDVPRYGSRFIRNRLHHAAASDKRLASWGPRFDGIDEMVRARPLDEICAEQWVRSVMSTEGALAAVAPERVHRLTYECFVTDPATEIERIVSFLGKTVSSAQTMQLARRVSPKSVGRWRHDLSPSAVSRLEPMLAPTLERHGYA